MFLASQQDNSADHDDDAGGDQTQLDQRAVLERGAERALAPLILELAEFVVLGLEIGDGVLLVFNWGGAV